MDQSGKALYLAGSHTWYLIHPHETRAQDNSHQHFEDFLGWMKSYGHNFTRLWTGWGNKITITPFMYKRTGPGNAIDGGLRFDCTQFDQAYFDLLRERVLQVQNRGLYCSVMFFGSLIGITASSEQPASWQRFVWNPINNVNPELETAFDENDYFTFYTKNPQALNIQKLLVAKMIDTLNDIDNLIWEVGNESEFPLSASWQKAMVRFVKQYESGKSKQHLVGITASWRNSNPQLLSGPHDWFSPDREIVDGYSFKDGGPPEYTGKVIIFDSDHFDGGLYDPTEIDIGISRAWKNFARGNHNLLMDAYDVNNPEWGNYGQVNLAINPIRAALGHTVDFANRFRNLAAMTPIKDLASTGYCLASDVEYLVYQPASEGFSVNLSPGTYKLEWLDVRDGSRSIPAPFRHDGGSRFFNRPPHVQGASALYLIKQ